MADRREAERRGRRGELAAAAALALKGYRIHGRRIRTGAGEIDLVAQRGSVIVFVEVKARPTVDRALEAVPPGAWRRIGRAAEIWMARRPEFASHGWRFDLIAVRPRAWPAHLQDVWRPDFAATSSY